MGVELGLLALVVLAYVGIKQEIRKFSKESAGREADVLQSIESRLEALKAKVTEVLSDNQEIKKSMRKAPEGVLLDLGGLKEQVQALEDSIVQKLSQNLEGLKEQFQASVQEGNEGVLRVLDKLSSLEGNVQENVVQLKSLVKEAEQVILDKNVVLLEAVKNDAILKKLGQIEKGIFDYRDVLVEKIVSCKEEVSQEISLVKGINEQTDKSLNRLMEFLEKLSNSLRFLHSAIGDLDSRLSDVSTKAIVEIQGLQKEIFAKHSEYKELYSELKTIDNKVEKIPKLLSEDREKVLDRKKACQQEVSEVKKRVSAIEEILVGLREAVLQQKGLFGELEALRNQLHSELEFVSVNCKAEVQGLLERISKAEKELVSKHSEYRELYPCLETLKKEVVQVRNLLVKEKKQQGALAPVIRAKFGLGKFQK